MTKCKVEFENGYNIYCKISFTKYVLDLLNLSLLKKMFDTLKEKMMCQAMIFPSTIKFAKPSQLHEKYSYIFILPMQFPDVPSILFNTLKLQITFF